MTQAAAGREAAAARIAAVFDDAGARGLLHARRIGHGSAAPSGADGPDDGSAVPKTGEEHGISLGPDEPVVLASVFKIVVAVAFARQVAALHIDPAERTTVTAHYRTGGVGTAGCADDVTMSWRDLARAMMTMSDNAATDVIYDRLGQDEVDRVTADLSLARTRLVGPCAAIIGSLADDLGIDPSAPDADARLAAADPAELRAVSALDPARTSASTAREIVDLLEAIWTDRAGPPAACGLVRSLMAQQIWPHRISSGFGDDAHIAAKTGTLPAIRNEAGVVSFPDGDSYAVAVFTRARSFAERQPAIDAAIGRAARIAVDALRGDEGSP